MITKAEYAEWLGKSTSDINDADFQKVLRRGQSKLEQALGYQLCPLSGLGIKFCPLVETPAPTENELAVLPTLQLPYRGFWQRFIQLPPFLKIYSVKFTTCDGDVEVLEPCDYRIDRPGGNMYLGAQWYNSLELCRPLLCGLAFSSTGLRCPGNCVTIEIQAYWGLCCGDLEEDADERDCCIPDDLKTVLLDMMAESDNCDKSNIKRESSLSYSYEKFEKVDLLVEYSGVIAKYALGRSSEYPI